MEFRISRGKGCRIELGERESEAVRIAAKNLQGDLEKVFGDGGKGNPEENLIRIETGAWPGSHAEAYRLSVRSGVLYITGSDRRGTVYGIYELSEMLGVSPWYFWADVPVKEKESFSLPEGFERSDYPAVEYRGIFINDEEELDRWARAHMGEETIGVRTYEKIFELLLRLKANYIWPAMHVNSFNMRRENGALADRMGIVVGTSHCDMLMRSNNREWLPWLKRKGYEGAEYDYSVPGKNREILKEYWRESVEQNREFEVCYTLGMRGIHDSGFETRQLSGLSGEALEAAKTDLLQKVMADQRQILRETLGHDTMMTFIPYKEVLKLYDGGLEIPEDITLVWANDNYGYIRRYPSDRERDRKGGNGIYYHNSYWAPPGMSYVFLCSIPLAHTAHELRKAYAEGIRKLWVLNVGALKPLEQETEFFLRLAWEIGKENDSTLDTEAYTARWIDKNFSGGIGGETARLLNGFSQLTNVRKLEMMDYDAFSQQAYGDEAVSRIHRYEELFSRGNALYRKLPLEERDAFFQLVLMRIHAGYFTNLAWYYGDRSTYAWEAGLPWAADRYAALARRLEDVRRRMLLYYNKRMGGGKWDGILDPEGFPPPRAAMLPVCTPSLGTAGKPGVKIALWNGGERLSFAKPGTKWLELGNTGRTAVKYELSAPGWVRLSQSAGMLEAQERILVSAEDTAKVRSGLIAVRWETADGAEAGEHRIPVETAGPVCVCGSVEEDGIVSVEAEDTESPVSGEITASGSAGLSAFRLIPWLGRDRGSLAEACLDADPDGYLCAPASPGKEKIRETLPQPLCYPVTFSSSGQFLLEVHRFPSLNTTGRIRIGISVDDGSVQILESASSDEHRGTWRENVRNEVDRLYLRLPFLEAGIHRICFWPVDRYFAFSRFVIYTDRRKENNLAGYRGEQALPRPFDPEAFAEEFYGAIPLAPRPVEYARVREEKDDLGKTSLILQAQNYAEQIRPEYYCRRGMSLPGEQDGAVLIDAASVLAGSEAAFCSGKAGDLWRHCGSESFGRRGLAMYVRQRGAAWEEGPEAPALNYRFRCVGGRYVLWLLACFGLKEESYFGAGFDGEILSRERLYGGGCLWRYEAEQIYRWVPVAEQELQAGEHLLQIYARSCGLRIDRICLIRGEKLPPADTEWKAGP